MLAHLQRSFPNVRDVHLALGGVCRYHLYVQIAKRQEGEAKNVIMGAFAGHYDIKQVIVVDEDVDIHNPAEVEWAVATRFQADRDLLIVTRQPGLEARSVDARRCRRQNGARCHKAAGCQGNEVQAYSRAGRGKSRSRARSIVDSLPRSSGGRRFDLWKKEERNEHGVVNICEPGSLIDSDAENVVSFARAAAGGVSDERERIIRVYHAVRDDILYDPYVDYTDPTFYRASSILEHGRGYCVSKASLLAAAAQLGTPARVGYADVKNYMSSPRLYERLKTDIYRLAFLYRAVSGGPMGEGDAGLQSDAVRAPWRASAGIRWLDPIPCFRNTTRTGRRHMEYLQDRGKLRRCLRSTPSSANSGPIIPTSCRVASPATFRRRRLLAIWIESGRRKLLS